MIELTEEPFDSPVAEALVEAMAAEVVLRYAAETEQLTERERAADEAAYRSEVRPETVARPQGAFLVAWSDGRPVGCGALRPLEGAPGVGEIKRMYTDPAVRGTGISRLVLARLEAVAAELGYTRLQLETGTRQPEAIALYASSGWAPIECYGYYRYAPTSRCFAKDLTS